MDLAPTMEIIKEDDGKRAKTPITLVFVFPLVLNRDKCI
jgi:hypothetical protein